MVSWSVWSYWLAGTLITFFALEIPAIRNAYKGDTLSEYVWGLGAWRFVIVAGLVWLTLHFGWYL